MLKKIAHFQVNHPYITLLVILSITLVMQGGVSSVRTVASLEKMMPTDVEEIEAFNRLRDNNMGKDIIAVIIELDRNSSIKGNNDIRNYEVYDYIKGVSKDLYKEPDVNKIHSFAPFIPENTTKNDYLNKIRMMEEKTSQFISNDYTTTMILITTDISADDSRMNSLASKVKKIVDDHGKPSSTKIKLTGTPIVQQKLGELIGKDRKNTKNISTLLVFIITAILFGTLTSALVPIIVVTISITWLYGIMGYFNLPISTLAGGVAAMVIGIGIDYSIHLMNKFKNERKKNLSIKDAIESALQNTGNALTGAAFATIIAFLAFLFGKMPEMNRFGLLMAIGVGSAFILSMFGLPALLIIEEKIIHKIRKGISFGVEGEYHLYGKDEIHPDDCIEEYPSKNELESLKKDYKIVRRKKK
ncbi:MAG: efflux RND transporter permease subunit [Nanobdellota archaeon]